MDMPKLARFRSIEVVDVVAIINSPRAEKPRRTVDFNVPDKGRGMYQIYKYLSI